MKKLVLLLVLAIIASPVYGLSNSAGNRDAISQRISIVETVSDSYQSIILSLNSQGALVSKPIEMLSEVKDMISQSKSFLSSGMIDEANRTIEEAGALLPKITLDTRSSFKVNRGRLALEESMSLIMNARNHGYDVKEIEDMYYNASSLYDEAKQNYLNQRYDSIDPEIDALLITADKISYEIEILKSVTKPIASSSATGFLIVSYSWMSVPIIILITSTFVVMKISRRKKQLKGIEKLVRIKSRME